MKTRPNGHQCPAMSPTGDQCTLARGPINHVMIRGERTGLGLPRPRHVTKDGQEWVDHD